MALTLSTEKLAVSGFCVESLSPKTRNICNYGYLPQRDSEKISHGVKGECPYK
jgi:hypothetical protein